MIKLVPFRILIVNSQTFGWLINGMMPAYKVRVLNRIKGKTIRNSACIKCKTSLMLTMNYTFLPLI